LYQLLLEAGAEYPKSIVHWFTDSSWQDCPDGRSTGCHLGFFQGGLIDMGSLVPNPIALSSAEAETNILTVGVQAAAHSRMIIMEIEKSQPDFPLTIPVYTDSSAAVAITSNEKTTQRTRHIERRFLFCRQAQLSGMITVQHFNGDLYQLADVGTKNLPSTQLFHKIAYMTGSPTDSSSI
jgi:hypothetical protein